MAQFVVMGQVQKNKLYLSYEGAGSTTWVDKLAKAKLFSTQRDADTALQEITSEPDGIKIFGELSYTAPRTLKNLVTAGYGYADSMDVKLSVVAISTVVLSTERWHVENAKGKTKRLS